MTNLSDDSRRVVHTFEKNSMESVCISVSRYKGRDYADIRVFFEGDDGALLPSRKGLTISPSLLHELEIGLEKLKDALDINE